MGLFERLIRVWKIGWGWKDAAGFENRVVPGEHLCRGFFSSAGVSHKLREGERLNRVDGEHIQIVVNSRDNR